MYVWEVAILGVFSDVQDYHWFWCLQKQTTLLQWVYIECILGTECTSGSVRPVGGLRPYEGLVEVCIFQSWHPVCNASFSYSEDL